ncbi:MAG: AAA family ATPase [Bacteroidota bacterium]
MKRGLVIGKFMPVHNGHITLINFAEVQCDELIVSMSYTPQDPIDAKLRFSWLCDIFKDRPNIKPSLVEDNFDNESLSLEERTKLWAKFVQKTFPPIDLVFSSEAYGDPLARHLGAHHHSFDPQRKSVPVSASVIRERPLRHWDFIPLVVRPYFVKKICFYGPESTGKSVMAQKMAAIYNTEFVPEVARELIDSNDFTVEDIVRIGHAHHQRICEKLKTANKFLFCDTDVITTQIYSRHYLNEVPPVLFELEKQTHYDLYFLFDIDVAWVEDGLRDLGDQRTMMYDVFKNELQKRNIPFLPVKGTWAEREQFITRHVNALI